jgi:hypothetical protein
MDGSNDKPIPKWVLIVGVAILTFLVVSLLPSWSGRGTPLKIMAALIAAGVTLIVAPRRSPTSATLSNSPASLGPLIDAGARGRLQAKAAQVAAGVYRFWDQGITVDVTYADGRVEKDNTLYGVAEHSLLQNGGRYLKALADQPGRSYLAVVGGDTHVRLVLQPSPNRIVRTFNGALPSEWIGSIVLVPKTQKKLIGLLRLRSDLPSQSNTKLIERAKRLFVQHSGGVDVRDMSDAEVAEHVDMLPPNTTAYSEEPPYKNPWEERQEAVARQKLKRQQDEERYNELLKASALKQEMPFQAWVSKQKDEDLWMCSPPELLAHLDNSYGGPNVVDAFHLRGMKHALRADIFSADRVSHSQLSSMDGMVFERFLVRQRIAASENEGTGLDDHKALRAKLNEMAAVAERLGLSDLAAEYWDEAWLCLLG